MQYPVIDPVLVNLGSLTFPWGGPLHTIGPIKIRWYAVAYLAALLLGWRLVRRLARAAPPVASLLQVDDFLTWATLGVVVGGRMGYVLFYHPSAFLAAPLAVFAVWDGGMSFHGGMLGVATAIALFCRQQRIPVLGLADRIAVAAPIGLFLGRLANFVNGELWGRAASPGLPWAMVFPMDPEQIPRHPSQLYQAAMEGVLLFAAMLLLSRQTRLRARFGFLTGAFLAGYAVARIVGEVFREPDWFMGYLSGGLTMGQLLSLPMLLAGLFLMWRARPVAAVAPGAA